MRWTAHRPRFSRFQPTLPHRERLALRYRLFFPLVFQPTLPHRERHPAPSDLPQTAGISTHAPAQGATSRSIRFTANSRYFNPRSRTGSDFAGVRLPGEGGISTHAPAQGATRKFSAWGHCFPFQPTLPHRERPTSLYLAHPSTRYFNPRSRTGSDGFPWWRPARTGRFQPTLPHRERHASFPGTEETVRISTHAPAQGATHHHYHHSGAVRFQPTLPHRERHGKERQLVSVCKFQPTLPHRERRIANIRKNWTYMISTHAPAQGATSSVRVATTPLKYFNPCSRTGSDFGRRKCSFSASYFNPRSRTGSDGGFRFLSAGCKYFNPRSRTGSDNAICFSVPNKTISTHAPAQGATNHPVPAQGPGGISTHAPAQGATCPPAFPHWPHWHFNPRSRTGSDSTLIPFNPPPFPFQPTLPHRERHASFPGTEETVRISTHAPAQGAT